MAGPSRHRIWDNCHRSLFSHLLASAMSNSQTIPSSLSILPHLHPHAVTQQHQVTIPISLGKATYSLHKHHPPIKYRSPMQGTPLVYMPRRLSRISLPAMPPKSIMSSHAKHQLGARRMAALLFSTKINLSTPSSAQVIDKVTGAVMLHLFIRSSQRCHLLALWRYCLLVNPDSSCSMDVLMTLTDIVEGVH